MTWPRWANGPEHWFAEVMLCLAIGFALMVTVGAVVGIIALVVTGV